MWQDAMRVCKEYTPHKLQELQDEYEREVLTKRGGAGPGGFGTSTSTTTSSPTSPLPTTYTYSHSLHHVLLLLHPTTSTNTSY